MRFRSSLATWSDSLSWAGDVDGKRVSRELEASRATERAHTLSAPVSEYERVGARCGECSRSQELTPKVWRCACGGALELEPAPAMASRHLQGEGLWRYLPWLPVHRAVSLGEPTTPLVELAEGTDHTLLKLEGSLPTGSFKDRGAAVLVSWLAESGERHVVEDSSGNAGTALAAYCARAGVACDLYVPDRASPEKVVQAQVYGARVSLVPGERGAATAAAIAAVDEGATYASHLWHPLFQAGTETFAFELWEQLGERAPDVVVLPVGAGSLLLGLERGFRRLKDSGLVDNAPRVFGIQSASCAPLADTTLGPSGSTNAALPDPAEGIRVVSPPRARSVVAAARDSGGMVAAVAEDNVWEAHRALGRLGVYAEPTAAIGFAGFRALLMEGLIDRSETSVIAVTSTGLKTATTIRARLAAEDEVSE